MVDLDSLPVSLAEIVRSKSGVGIEKLSVGKKTMQNTGSNCKTQRFMHRKRSKSRYNQGKIGELKIF